jgi:hypothetical protein
MLIEYVNRMSIQVTDPDSCTLYKMSTGWRMIIGHQFKRFLYCNTEIVTDYKVYALESVMIMLLMMMMMMMTNHQRL